jgi:hypothetical protein
MAVPSDITYDEKKALVHKFDSLLLLLYTFLLRHTLSQNPLESYKREFVGGCRAAFPSCSNNIANFENII